MSRDIRDFYPSLHIARVVKMSWACSSMEDTQFLMEELLNYIFGPQAKTPVLEINFTKIIKLLIY
jgi:hypothetical protein